MSVAPNLIEFPVERARNGRESLWSELVEAVAYADGAAAAMRRIVGCVRREASATGVEWWGPGQDGALTRIVSSGTARGERGSIPLGRAGVLVIHGGAPSRELRSALNGVALLLHRRLNEERLAYATARLARRNEELDEFATLLAHEIKTPLEAALSASDPTESIEQALDLVEMLLAAAQRGPGGEVSTDPAGPLERAAASLGGELKVTGEFSVPLPIASSPLFVILRNLLSNAASAGASHVRVTSKRSYHCARLVVEDDGAGICAEDHYATGSRIGLSLCRQVAARSAGVLELVARVPNGSCATVTFAPASA